MILVGSILVLAIFLFVGWLISVEMFQHRAWRHRVEQGDTAIVSALVLEAMGGWQRLRAPRGTPPALWAAVQEAELVATTDDIITVSAGAEPAFQHLDGERRQVSSALDEAKAVAARLAEMLMYDVPNLRIPAARVDVYTTFGEPGRPPEQRPILSLTVDRTTADNLRWDTLTPAEIISRFEAIFEVDGAGQPRPIALPPIEGDQGSQSPEEPWANSDSSPQARATERD